MSTAKLLIAIFFCSVLIIGGCVPRTEKESKDEKTGMTLEEAKEKAKAELKKLDYAVEDMNFTADEGNTAWQKYVADYPSVLQDEIVKKMNLQERNYLAIYCAPKKLYPGGGGWVFVDADDGTILGLILGE